MTVPTMAIMSADTPPTVFSAKFVGLVVRSEVVTAFKIEDYHPIEIIKVK